jgi:hypothetical protein
MSQADRWEAIKLAWNTHKPEGYMQLDGRVNLPLLIAIETQTKRLKIDRDDYDTFIGAVLRGAAADDWWSAKSMKASSLFGFSANIPDAKFENVEKLYRSGLRIEAPKAKPVVCWRDDASVLEFASQFKSRQAPTKVFRVRGATQQIRDDIRCWVFDKRNLQLGLIGEDNFMYITRCMRLSEAGVKLQEDWVPEDALLLVYPPEAGEDPVTWTMLDQFAR